MYAYSKNITSFSLSNETVKKERTVRKRDKKKRKYKKKRNKWTMATTERAFKQCLAQVQHRKLSDCVMFCLLATCASIIYIICFNQGNKIVSHSKWIATVVSNGCSSILPTTSSIKSE